MGTLTFRTIEQAALFELEIKVQLSDGFWENTRPADHHKIWCKANVTVGTLPGRNFGAYRDKYNLTNKDLLEVVGDRMIAYVKAVRVLGFNHLDDVRYCIDIDGNVVEEAQLNGPGAYWEQRREQLANIDLVALRAAVAANTYTMKDLKADLKEMKTAMQTYRQPK